MLGRLGTSFVNAGWFLMEQPDRMAIGHWRSKVKAQKAQLTQAPHGYLVYAGMRLIILRAKTDILRVNT
jgi:hypothetical protein